MNLKSSSQSLDGVFNNRFSQVISLNLEENEIYIEHGIEEQTTFFVAHYFLLCL